MLEALKLESPPARPENIIVYVRWIWGENYWDRDREFAEVLTFLRHQEGIANKGKRTWELTKEAAPLFWEWLERHNAREAEMRKGVTLP